MTPEKLREIMPFSLGRSLDFAGPLTDAMREFKIDNALRQSAFLAQCAHESGSLQYVRELASGEAYEGRADLGNVQPGDGVKYKGRGLLQITGRKNYTQCGQALGLPLIERPELLERPVNACRSAAWYWHSRNLNRYADAVLFASLTKAINGGYTGLDDRIQHFIRARKALGL